MSRRVGPARSPAHQVARRRAGRPTTSGSPSVFRPNAEPDVLDGGEDRVAAVAVDDALPGAAARFDAGAVVVAQVEQRLGQLDELPRHDEQTRAVAEEFTDVADARGDRCAAAG